MEIHYDGYFEIMAYILILETIIFIFHFIPGGSKGVGTVINVMLIRQHLQQLMPFQGTFSSLALITVLCCQLFSYF